MSPKLIDRLLLAGAVLCLVVGFTMVAKAHGLAAWIMADPNYKTSLLWPEFDSHCCGPADCEPYPASKVKLGPNGYVLEDTGEVIPYMLVYSTPGKVIEETGYEFWRCRFVGYWNMQRDGKPLDGKTRCFFAPGGGA